MTAPGRTEADGGGLRFWHGSRGADYSGIADRGDLFVAVGDLQGAAMQRGQAGRARRALRGTGWQNQVALLRSPGHRVLRGEGGGVQALEVEIVAADIGHGNRRHPTTWRARLQGILATDCGSSQPRGDEPPSQSHPRHWCPVQELSAWSPRRPSSREPFGPARLEPAASAGIRGPLRASRDARRLCRYIPR